LTKRRTYEEAENIVNNLGYYLLDYYSDDKNRTRVVIQDEIGYKYDIFLGNLFLGNIPDFVAINNPYTLENIVLWLSINRPEFNLLDDNEYTGSGEKLVFFHNISKCKEKFRMSWTNVYKGIGCSVCKGFQLGERTSLAYLRPDLAKEWHSDNELSPEEVTVSSGKKIFWICSTCRYGENGEWKTSIQNRSGGTGCPACSGNVVSDKNRLSIIYPDISLEWDYNLNEDSPDDVSYASRKIRLWICGNGHNSYPARIADRTSKESGCKQCSDERQESIIATELKEYFIYNYNAEKEYPIFRNPETNYPLPFDIYIPCGENPEINGIYIEIHGIQHYKMCLWNYSKAKKNGTTPQEEFEYQKKKDGMKREFAKENGIYIEIDLRNIKSTKEAIEYINSIAGNFLWLLTEKVK
jgi:hypothetical protein